MQCEGDGAVGRRTHLTVAVQYFDVDVLVERAGQAIAGGGDDAPTPAVVRDERNGRIVRRITQAEQGQFLERTIENHPANGGSLSCSECHQGWKVWWLRRWR